MSKIEKLVRQFLLESKFFGETSLSLYHMFQQTYHHFDISYEQFLEAFNIMQRNYVEILFDKDSTMTSFASRDKLDPVRITETNFIREKLKNQSLKDALSEFFDDEKVSYHLTCLDANDIYRARREKTDYTIHRIDMSQGEEVRTVEYSVTAEDFLKQIKNARKEIEYYGKESI